LLALTQPLPQVTRTGDRQHCTKRFDGEPIRMDANYLAPGEFRWIELASVVKSALRQARRELAVKLRQRSEEWFE